MKVISFCDIPEELTANTWLEEFRCGSYVPYTIQGDGYSKLDDYLTEQYPELVKTKILIDIDY